MRLLLLTFISLVFFGASAQNNATPFGFEQRSDIKVIANGDSVINAWAGGINYAQVQPLDLDLDGTRDVVVFDKNSDRILTFLNRSQAGNTIYKYAPEYEVHFPIPYSWLIIKDFNCDGKNDIFYNRNDDVYVLENTSGSELSFAPALDTALMEVVSGSLSRMYVSKADIPAIADIDNDGDLDIISFGNSAPYVEFHENLSNCGLQFRLEHSCWGHFEESALNTSLHLGSCSPWKKKAMHAGGTLLALDLDGDGVKDMLVGDVSYSSATALYNTGTADSAYMSSQDTLFPSYGQSINIFQFPAFSYLDVTGDGVSDLITSPFTSDGGANYNSVHLYTNQGTQSNPVFNYTRPDFLQDKMIDLGQGAVPRLVDLTGDGLLDLVVSNDGELDTTTELLNHYYHYYQNTGTATDPEFTLMDANFLDISSYSIGKHSIPAFGDLDGDGDQDLIVGDENGMLHYFTNSNSNSPNFSLQTAGITANVVGTIDVGNNAAPFLHDMNGDGTLDLIIGNRKGNLHYYTNQSATSLDFHRESTFYGSVNTYRSSASAGFAVPYVVGGDSASSLFVGSGSIGILQLDNLDEVTQLPGELIGTAGTGSLVSSNFEESPFGINKKNGRNQFLLRASELKALGLVSGDITHLGFDVTTMNNNTVYDLRIRLKHTQDTVLTGFAQNMTTVYSATATPVDKGWTEIPLHTPFRWDGRSGLIAEICFDGQPQGNTTPPYFIKVRMTDVGFDSYAYGDYVDPTLQGKGCVQPLKAIIQKRPNVRVEISPAFDETSDYLTHMRHTAPALGDLDGDGYADMLVGNQGGGLTYYKGKEYIAPVPEQEDHEARNAFDVFPNPGSGVYNIELAELGSADLRIFDLTGKLLLKREITQSRSTVDLSDKPRGIYLFIVNKGEEVTTQKVVLE